MWSCDAVSLMVLDPKRRPGNADTATSGNALARDLILVRMQTEASAERRKIEVHQSKKASHKTGALLNAQDMKEKEECVTLV